MTDLIRSAVEAARRQASVLGLDQLRSVAAAAGLDGADDVRVLMNHLRAGGSGIAEALEQALPGAPDGPQLAAELLCAAEPVAPVPSIFASVLAARLPDHPVARMGPGIEAAFVFSALQGGGSITFDRPQPLDPRGQIVLVDYDVPLSRWIEGWAEPSGGRVVVTGLRSTGLPIDRRVIAPLILFCPASQPG